MNEIVCDRICKDMYIRIGTGKISGQDVITELTIAADYQVSRGTAREALQRLRSEKFLISLPRKGYMVRQITQRDYNHIISIRYSLELIALKTIINSRSDEEIRSLCDNVAAPNSGSFNSSFHLAVAQLSGNNYLYDILDSLVHACSLYIAANLPENANITNQHSEIVQALLRRDVAEADKYLRMDLNID